MHYIFIYFLSIAIAIILTTIGVTLGQAMVAQGTIDALNIQPRARNSIMRISLLGIALIETSGVLALVISMLLLFTKKPAFITNVASNLPSLGIGLAIGISALVVGLASGYPAKAACLSVANQPFIAGRILNFTLLSLSFIQTPIIFSFLFSLLIWYQTSTTIDFYESIRLLSIGLAIGFGGVGPAIGLSLFSRKTCTLISFNKNAYDNLRAFSFITQAIIETPIIFAMITALVIIGSKANGNPIKTLAFVVAALTVGIGNFGPGIASANAASGGVKQIVENPTNASSVSRISMISQGIIDSCVIYSWIISILIIVFA